MVKALLLGYGHLGTALLEGLSESPDCEIAGVFRWSGRGQGTGHASDWFDDSEKPLAALVKKLGAHDIRCPGANSYDFVAELQRRQPDLLLVGSWGEILKPHILDFPGLSVINCHPSMLPAHRGANPYASVIRQGETQTGVSFHKMTPGVDKGPVYLQKPVAVLPDDTGGDLRVRCAETAKIMVVDLIKGLSDGSLKPAPQDESRASYFKPVTVEDGRIHWGGAPADLRNQSRALQPWLDCFGHLKGRMITCKKITLQAAPPQNEAPGTVLAVTPKALWVASSQPDTRLGLERYRLQWGYNLLPEGISRMLAPWLIRPGQAFS